MPIITFFCTTVHKRLDEIFSLHQSVCVSTSFYWNFLKGIYIVGVICFANLRLKNLLTNPWLSTLDRNWDIRNYVCQSTFNFFCNIFRQAIVSFRLSRYFLNCQEYLWDQCTYLWGISLIPMHLDQRIIWIYCEFMGKTSLLNLKFVRIILILRTEVNEQCFRSTHDRLFEKLQGWDNS